MVFFADNLNVFHVAKRTPPYSHWEPIYIGTNKDPLYDERLSWEGRSDKMTQVGNNFLNLLWDLILFWFVSINSFQGYQLCVLDYEFMILDNAFLIHRPGIKTKTDNLSQTQKNKVAAQNTLISKTIIPELKKLYGNRRGCEKWGGNMPNLQVATLLQILPQVGSALNKTIFLKQKLIPVCHITFLDTKSSLCEIIFLRKSL